MNDERVRIRFERMNMEAECLYDITHNRGFLINDMPFSDVDKSIRNIGGPRSPLYGTTYGDQNEFMDRYRCKCGKYIGAMFEGEVCPDCKTKIEFKDVDILYTGWLNFYPYKVINPIYYIKLQSALSKKALENIISNDNIITSDGIIRKHNDVIEVKKSTLKYHNIGLHEFYKNYEEIMMYFRHKRRSQPKKVALIDQLIEQKDLVWTSKFPVYSTVLRPQGITTESYYFSTIDKKIHPLTSITLSLKTAAPIQVPLYLYQAQMRLNELWELNFSLIYSKHGWIRSNVLGGCFNYTGRNVIVLDPTLKLDEVDMPYKTFVVMFSGLIVSEIIRDKGWTITKAHNFLKARYMYDEYIYSVIERILAQREIHIILQRNPTITFGSILRMKIRRVLKENDNVTLAIPSAILPGLNADFDGDQLNSIGLMLEEVATMFEGFSPINMLINRTDESIRLDCSALENISIAMLSDL